jgi:hypothetical protein
MYIYIYIHIHIHQQSSQDPTSWSMKRYHSALKTVEISLNFMVLALACVLVCSCFETDWLCMMHLLRWSTLMGWGSNALVRVYCSLAMCTHIHTQTRAQNANNTRTNLQVALARKSRHDCIETLALENQIHWVWPKFWYKQQHFSRYAQRFWTDVCDFY